MSVSFMRIESPFARSTISWDQDCADTAMVKMAKNKTLRCEKRIMIMEDELNHSQCNEEVVSSPDFMVTCAISRTTFWGRIRVVLGSYSKFNNNN